MKTRGYAWGVLLLSTFSILPAFGIHRPEPRLRSIFYKNHALKDFVDADTQLLVVTFFGTKCPLVPQVLPTLKALDAKYAKKGVRFLAVYAGTGLHVTEMALHAQNFDIPFRTLLDTDQLLAKRYGVQRLTETLVLDAKAGETDRKLPVLYRGAVDDQAGVGFRKAEAAKHYLADALAQALAKEKVVEAATTPEGCLIQFGPPKTLPNVTFYKDVLPIVQARCQNCHREGEAGPMALMTYEDVSSYGSQIQEMVEDRRMPPWPGHSPLPFTDDQRLTPAQVATIRSWVETDMEEGDKKDAPKPIVWPNPKDWRIGKPDLVFRTKSFKVPATGYLQYQYYLVPTKLTEDKFIQAIEVRTNAPQVVHHIQVLEGKPDADVKEPVGPIELDPFQIVKLHGFTLEDSKLLGNYVPGNNDNALTYPSDKGLRIRKGAILFFETHYTTNGTATDEEAEVGIIFRKDPPRTEVKTQWFYRNRGHFKIPAGDGHARLDKDDIFVKNEDVRINSLRLHLHARGKNFLIEKVTPLKDGGEKVEKLLQIPSWDFNWQRNYYFAVDPKTGKSPITLIGGESLRATAHWDNTRWNPGNPDPKRDTYWGQQTKDEMMAIMMTYEGMSADEVRAAQAKRGAK